MLSLRVLGGRSLAWTSQGSVPPGAHFLAYSCAPWLLAPACTSRPALHLPLSSSQLFSDFFFHFTLFRTLLRVGGWGSIILSATFPLPVLLQSEEDCCISRHHIYIRGGRGGAGFQDCTSRVSVFLSEKQNVSQKCPNRFF